MKDKKQMTCKTMIGMWIVTLNILGYGVIEIFGAIDHFDRLQWDLHAKYHAMNGLLWLLTMFAVCLVLLWHHVKRQDFVAWGLVTLVGVGVFGGAVTSDPLTDGGLYNGETALTTGAVAYWAGWAALATWLLGMLLVLPHVRSRSRDVATSSNEEIVNAEG